LAEECERLACEIKDASTRQILLDLAIRWRTLADQDERGSRKATYRYDERKA
jgi:hypothetical protein